jgi:ABC-type nickel/cobalt efflux system permease component RcnA
MDILMIRGDFIFSNWILIWFIIYYIGLIEFSPIFILTFALLENIFLLGVMAVNKVRFITILQFAIIVLFMKFIPFYLIRNDTIKINDIIFTLLLFNLYLVWLLVNGKDFVQISHDIVSSLVTDHPQTTYMMLLQNLEKKFKGYFS